MALLRAEKLPVEDLPLSLENFFTKIADGEIVGVAGIEIYGDYGLMRSLAVSKSHRGIGLAGKLLQQVERLAASKNLKTIYLLTETAPDYFEKKSYEKITRADVPPVVQKSSEFSHVCPQSAIVMQKKLS